MSSEVLPSTLLPSGQGGAPHTGATNGSIASQAEYGSYFVATYPPFSRWAGESLALYEEILEGSVAPEQAPPLDNFSEGAEKDIKRSTLPREHS